MRAVVVLVNPGGELQDFYLTLSGRSTAVIFSDLEKARELAGAVTAAWSQAGYTGSVLTLKTESFQDAVRELTEMWPDYRKNAFLEDTDPAVDELIEWLRSGGRLGGPST